MITTLNETTARLPKVTAEKRGNFGVRSLTSADELHAIDTVVTAFADDPVCRWVWPQSHQYLSSAPNFIRAFCGNAFPYQCAFGADNLAGVALWLPPNVGPDEAGLVEVIMNTVSESIRDDVFAIFEQMGKYHPSEHHWYLPMIGVHPSRQGNGLGEALMRHALERCDQDHVPAYLESTNPRNISLYQRHGFEPLGTIQVGSSPPLVPMLRAAR